MLLHMLASISPQQRMAPVVCSAADPPTAALFAALASLPERGSAAEQTVSSRRLFEAEAAAILELVDALEPKDPSVRDGWENSQALLGDWQLAYTSSSTFYENGGLTLCAPAGTCTTGELLLRFISAARGKGALEFVEPLADAAGTVVAQCSWVTASDGTLKVTPKTFTAGERSWAAVDRRGTDTVDFDRDKAIRILCACRPTYLDPSALVMRGLLPGVVWVFRRAAQESG